jgi:hypothetical protein
MGFAETLDSVVATDNRYSREAYAFLRDAADYIAKTARESQSSAWPSQLSASVPQQVRQSPSLSHRVQKREKMRDAGFEPATSCV